MHPYLKHKKIKDWINIHPTAPFSFKKQLKCSGFLGIMNPFFQAQCWHTDLDLATSEHFYARGCHAKVQISTQITFHWLNLRALSFRIWKHSVFLHSCNSIYADYMQLYISRSLLSYLYSVTPEEKSRNRKKTQLSLLHLHIYMWMCQNVIQFRTEKLKVESEFSLTDLWAKVNRASSKPSCQARHILNFFNHMKYIIE